MEFVRLSDLAAQVRLRAPGTPLDRVEAALTASAELTASADDLIGLFVAEARDAGCSWTEIGERIGVSKQAARQRFVRQPPGNHPAGGDLPASGTAGGLPQRRGRLAACLDAAGREARAEDAAEIGTEHLLAGLLCEGVAAAILERLGVRADAIRAASRDLFAASRHPREPAGHPPDQPASKPPAEPAGQRNHQPASKREPAGHPADQPGAGPPGGPAAGGPPESAEVREAIRRAWMLARRAGIGSAGPEHLLGAIVLDPGSRARRVLTHLGVSIPAIKKELECHVSPRHRRMRRPGKSAAGQCSFCGKQQAAGLQLIFGPGVAICAECVSLCDEMLAERE